MCGIAGFGFAPFLRERDISRMTDSLAHRGPDGKAWKYFNESDVALGSCLLSITDRPSRSLQPMYWPEAETWCVFNGEIYNHKEVRERLGNSVWFRTESDTETALAALARWGLDACLKFNGEWAMVLYCEKRGKITLIRDRYGIRPLYFMQRGTGVIFASELKAFWSISDVLKLKIDYEYALRALYDPAEPESSGLTLTKHISQVDPGCYVEFQRGKAPSSGRWWVSEEHKCDIAPRLDDQAYQLNELVSDACRLRFEHGGRAAVSISGGIDSATVAASILKSANAPHSGVSPTSIAAFSYRSPDSAFDESPWSSIVSQHLGIDLTYVDEPAFRDSGEAAEQFEASIFASEGLYYGSSFAHHLLYKSQSEGGFNVSMDGHGADELFGGYTWHAKILRKDVPLWKLKFWQSLLLEYRLLGSRASYAWLKKEITNGITLNKNRGIKSDLDTMIFHSCVFSDSAEYKFLFNRGPAGGSDDRIDSMLDRELYRTVLPRVLRHFDALAMSHGIETRAPFLDHRIVSFVSSLPLASRIGSGHTKLILRKAINGQLPDRCVWRRDKRGFHSSLMEPMTSILKPWIYDILSSYETYGRYGIDLRYLQRFFSDKILLGASTWQEQTCFWRFISLLVLANRLEGYRADV